jgi:hypothetical protein
VQATRAYDQSHSIWKTLPLHPRPARLEALSGYMLRLAEANGLKSLNELALLSGLHTGYRDVRMAPDYESLKSGKLALMAGCQPENLQDMTFSHLARHFGCPTHFSSGMRTFFEGSVAASLRYCPGCLADQPYYRLCWRFLALAGCAIHRCFLLSNCGYCSAPIPLLPLRPRVAYCATCQRDLRTCPMFPLPQQIQARLQKRTSDLEWLLMPIQQAPEITSTLLQGSGFFFLRQRRHLSLREVAHLMDRDPQVIAEMEEGNWGGKATLADYWQYTEILDSSLSDVIEATQMMRNSQSKRRLSRLDDHVQLIQTRVAQELRLALTEHQNVPSAPTHPKRALRL